MFMLVWTNDTIFREEDKSIGIKLVDSHGCGGSVYVQIGTGFCWCGSWFEDPEKILLNVDELFTI